MNTPQKTQGVFHKLYDGAGVGVAAPHDAVLSASPVPLTTLDKNLGILSMNGFTGADFIVTGDTADRKFKYEIYFIYEINGRPEDLSNHDDSMYVQIRACVQAGDNLIGAEAGLAGEYVPAEELFADTFLGITLSTHGQALQDGIFGTTPGGAVANIITPSNTVADEIGMLSIRHVTCNAIRFHIYVGASTSYATANVYGRRVMTP